jgi:uncharacterized short protein YbdD (DUF466 family)
MLIKRYFIGALEFVRRISGDDAYERYVKHHKQQHANISLMNRRDFYLAEQQRKWTGIKRCC